MSLAVAVLSHTLALKGGLFLKTGLEGALGAALLAWLSVQPWSTSLRNKRSNGELPSPEATFGLIRSRRSIFLKDFNEEQVGCLPG